MIYDQRIKPTTNIGILLIDMQNEFLKKFNDQDIVQRLVGKQIEILEIARRRKTPLAVVEQIDGLEGKDLGEIHTDLRREIMFYQGESYYSNFYKLGMNA